MKTIYQKGELIINKLTKQKMIIVDRFKGKDGRILCRFYHRPSGQYMVGEFLKEELNKMPAEVNEEITGFKSESCLGTPSSPEEIKS